MKDPGVDPRLEHGRKGQQPHHGHHGADDPRSADDERQQQEAQRDLKRATMHRLKRR